VCLPLFFPRQSSQSVSAFTSIDSTRSKEAREGDAQGALLVPGRRSCRDGDDGNEDQSRGADEPDGDVRWGGSEKAVLFAPRARRVSHRRVRWDWIGHRRTVGGTRPPSLGVGNDQTLSKRHFENSTKQNCLSCDIGSECNHDSIQFLIFLYLNLINVHCNCVRPFNASERCMLK